MWGLGVATLNKVKNPSITYSRPSLHPGCPLPIQGTSASMDLTNHRLHGTAAFTTGKKKKKKPSFNQPVAFKPMLFKEQMYRILLKDYSDLFI